jgi:polar amino acid transport system substrate-binding protein
MRKQKFRVLLVMLASFALIAAACSSNDEPSESATPSGGGDMAATVCADSSTSGDLLAQICENGTIRVSTDPAYPPQSSLNETTGEYEGFDIDVATAIAEKLGVDIEWQEPSWDVLIAGNWNDRWDMSVGSMTPTTERAQVLDFSPAYYFTPASVAVSATSDITEPSELSGKTIGVCSGCTYDQYLQGSLEIPDYTFDYGVITDPVIKGYDTDSTAIQDVVSGRNDGVMSATPTLQSAIDKGKPIKIVGEPLFYEPLSVAFDKSSELDDATLVDAVSNIIEEMHADGSLSDLSMKWYNEDLTVSMNR